MPRNKFRFGKVLERLYGYNIRMMIKSVTDEKTKQTTKNHTGKYGIYAGKNLIEQTDSVEKAIEKIKAL